METYSAVITYDVEAFSGHPGVRLPGLQQTLRRAVTDACSASGLTGFWATASHEERGDGALVVLSQQALPRLIDTFPAKIQNILHNLAHGPWAPRLRLRIALDAGLVDDPRATSTTKTNVCRLVDSAVLREALAKSDPSVTFTALLLSAEVFESHVKGGRTTLRPTEFTRHQVRVKTYERDAYLYVPRPSFSGADTSKAADAQRHTPEVSEHHPTPPQVHFGNHNNGTQFGDQNYYHA